MTSSATPERWRRVVELLDAALEKDPAERDAFLDAACPGDPELRREVASLLASSDQAGPLDRLAADIAPVAAQIRSAASLAGRTIGRYQVLERLAGGGMGVVYKALDTRLDRTVALKFLHPRLGADDSAAERFRLEARAVAALEHPNICTVHEIGETDDGQLFLAMPLYDGETLQDRIARGSLQVDEAVTIAIQIARGLAKAHARGIVHRDIKPSNVLVTSDGVVKVLDFGIAKLVDVTLTGQGGPLGTVAYMSPEQARGAPLDHRTDIWSLGVVLYEMLTGLRPFPGERAAAVLDAIERGEPIPVSMHRPDVPPALTRVVATALAPSPDGRYESASSFEADLLALGLAAPVSGGVATPLPAGGRGPARAQGRRVGRGIVAASVLGLAALALWFVMAWSRRQETSTAVPTTIAVLPFADRSPGGDQEYFSDGITEELIATLARVEGLQVASRTSAFAYKGRGVDIRTVGAQLGVGAVLEGSVRRDGDRLRITAQLVKVIDGYPLWSTRTTGTPATPSPSSRRSRERSRRRFG